MRQRQGLTHTSTNSNQRGQCSLVKRRWALILENLAGAIQCARVLRGCLQSHLDDIYQWSDVGVGALCHLVHIPNGCPGKILAIGLHSS